MPSISDLTRNCISQLNDLISSDTLIQHQNEVPLPAWKDELGRLRLWAGNIGAHQTGQSSLEYRLRDASHITSQTIKILGAIERLITELQATLRGKDEQEQDLLDEDIQDLVAELALEDGSNGTIATQEAHESLVEKIGLLFDISMAVRRPAHHDRLIGIEKGDAEPFKFHFRQHISERFPGADRLLVDHVSSAMARQRAVLKYRERRHQKLSQGMPMDIDTDSTVQPSEPYATTFIEESGRNTSTEPTSDSEASASSYAGSFPASDERPAVPPLPKEAEQQAPFQCPYCYYIITVKDRQEWERHIFRDLSPYTCIFLGCSTKGNLYDSRRDWYSHIRQNHLEAQDVGGSYTCPLCAEGQLPNDSFEMHVGRHLEELALFVLPRDAEDDEVTIDESADIYQEPESGVSNPEDNGSQVESSPSAGLQRSSADTQQPLVRGLQSPDLGPDSHKPLETATEGSKNEEPIYTTPPAAGHSSVGLDQRSTFTDSDEDHEPRAKPTQPVARPTGSWVYYRRGYYMYICVSFPRPLPSRSTTMFRVKLICLVVWLWRWSKGMEQQPGVPAVPSCRLR